nr:flagellar biosynthesis protein FliQ [Lachnospiraceae bacterium]
RNALFLIVKVSLPLLLISLIIGLIISIIQTVTSIQEQTLTFVPKVLGIFLGLMILGHWMMNSMVEFTVELWSQFPLYIHR